MSSADDAIEAAALWCVQLSEGELGEQEWRRFEAWLETPGHAGLLEDATAVWQASGAIGDWPGVIALRTKALHRFGKAKERRSFAPSSARFGWAMGYAAALLLAVTASLVWYGNRPLQYQTGIGERQVMVLGDGSHVSLDAVTAMKVRMKDETRQVELVGGRAKFDVAKDPLRPFTVAAGDKLIVAVGTSFSVELIDGQVRVVLYEGQVEVRDRSDTTRAAGAARRLVMTPGSELVGAVGSAQPPQVSRPDLSQSLSWEQGLVNFDAEPLGRAVEQMNRYSAKHIRLADPALEEIKVDGVYRAGDLDAFVEGITALHPVRQKTTGDEIVLEGR
ncbi:transmembrane sensor [Sphingopyxis panaciterrae]|uniref:FecR family protein n=1 Tax=Sphingopyxis panaciterrae TaxID=363841 RepID=UPI001423FBBF|nr:FecR domain-containing protein [Sphingopyxis panaciterrae]NIJ35377.1 transmembrane sensor [Sphingopyxis panaciterrae]